MRIEYKFYLADNDYKFEKEDKYKCSMYCENDKEAIECFTKMFLQTIEFINTIDFENNVIMRYTLKQEDRTVATYIA